MNGRRFREIVDNRIYLLEDDESNHSFWVYLIELGKACAESLTETEVNAMTAKQRETLDIIPF